MIASRVRIITCLGLLAGIALSPRLWFAIDRAYPPAPLFDVLAGIPAWIDPLLSTALVAFAIAGVFGVRRSLPLMTIAVAILVARDQSRLQPWVFEYCALAIALCGDKALTLTTCRAVTIGLYFWSGVQKLNATFVSTTWREFTADSPALANMGIIVPFFEIATAVALAFPRTRRAGIYAAVAVHGAVLVSLMRSGENTVVWPWNLAMAALAIVLFREKPQRSTGNWQLATGNCPQAAVIVMCCAMPLLSFWGYWDAYISAALYSGNTIQAVILVPPDAVERFPLVVQNNTWQQSTPMFIDINRWSYDELNVPGYPAKRVYKRVSEQVCRTYLPDGAGALRILGRPGALDRSRELETFPCTQFAAP